VLALLDHLSPAELRAPTPKAQTALELARDRVPDEAEAMGVTSALQRIMVLVTEAEEAERGAAGAQPTTTEGGAVGSPDDRAAEYDDAAITGRFLEARRILSARQRLAWVCWSVSSAAELLLPSASQRRWLADAVGKELTELPLVGWALVWHEQDGGDRAQPGNTPQQLTPSKGEEASFLQPHSLASRSDDDMRKLSAELWPTAEGPQHMLAKGFPYIYTIANLRYIYDSQSRATVQVPRQRRVLVSITPNSRGRRVSKTLHRSRWRPSSRTAFRRPCTRRSGLACRWR
jgi:hypothetical protein